MLDVVKVHKTACKMETNEYFSASAVPSENQLFIIDYQ